MYLWTSVRKNSYQVYSCQKLLKSRNHLCEFCVEVVESIKDLWFIKQEGQVLPEN